MIGAKGGNGFDDTSKHERISKITLKAALSDVAVMHKALIHRVQSVAGGFGSVSFKPCKTPPL